MNRFIDQRKDNWQRLEFLLEQLTGTSLNVLSRTEIRELGELYRRAAADLAMDDWTGLQLAARFAAQ